jgi:Na+-transporting NADH:ubiquinone oxidoreductase subunit C
MQKADLKIVIFTLVMCVLSSILLAGTVKSLGGKIGDNQESYRKLNILKAFRPDHAPDGHALTPEESAKYFEAGQMPNDLINAYYTKFVRETEVEINRDGQRVKAPLFLWEQDGKIIKYAFPAEGMGLWSVVHSYIALKTDLATIHGITFFDHGETPGLGGECSKPWFQNNFIGKKLLKDGKPVDFKVVKGKVKDKATIDPETAVDGMAASTLTGNGIQAFINSSFAAYNTHFETIRGK